MVNIASDLLEKIRQQFDSSPYPRIPLNASPKNEPNLLYLHSFFTAYYLRNQKVIDTKCRVILDAGCGSGYKSLILAEANPGSKIVGVDISPESIKLAQQRLKYHGFDNAEFHVLSLEELPGLNYQFDYINCDELLSILSDLNIAFQAIKSVLKPEGIIRANLHSSLQRFHHYRAQKIFNIMGLMSGNPEDMEIEIVKDTMTALQNNVELKAKMWRGSYEGDKGKERILMNYLLQGDKGFTINDIFSALQHSNLEFIKIVNWRQWELMDLFKEPDNLPTFLANRLQDMSIQERLQMFQLLHPVDRLIDFWCGHPDSAPNILPVKEWTDSHWPEATVHLCPQLKTAKFEQQLIACIKEIRPFPISEHLSLVEGVMEIDGTIASCLIPLLEQPQPMMSLVKHWQKLRPIDPVTLEPTELQTAFNTVKNLLITLENFGYIMLERNNNS
jgi:ubiquinone/menaquinone biosynthesis C-methylase UbiE